MSSINLLPIREQRAVRNEYRLRVFVVLGTGLSFAVIAGALMIIPTYIHNRSEKAFLENRLAFLQEASERDKNDVSETIKETNRELAIVKNINNATKTSDVFEDIIEILPRGIRIVGLHKDKKETSEIITVRGVASTRSELLSFADSLRRNTLFARVDVPISNFASNRDIEFTLSLVIAHDKK